MKTVKVVAAIIKAVNENGETIIFATQRGYGDFKGGWEFPGGKIESGETPQEAVKREIIEELDTEVSVGELMDTVEYDYPQFHLSMDCIWCHIVRGNLVLKEHEAARWLTKDELNNVEWLPADISLIEKIKDTKEKPTKNEYIHIISPISEIKSSMQSIALRFDYGHLRFLYESEGIADY